MNKSAKELSLEDLDIKAAAPVVGGAFKVSIRKLTPRLGVVEEHEPSDEDTSD